MESDCIATFLLSFFSLLFLFFLVEVKASVDLVESVDVFIIYDVTHGV